MALPAAWEAALHRVAPDGTAPDLERADHERWLRDVAGRYFAAPFADHHHDLWRWVWNLTPGVRPRPFVAIWNRGGAKSTSAEVAITAVGARKARRYALYVCDTQDRADDHVTNVAAVLESRAMERHHPEMARRLLSKYGHSRGWTRNRLRTASGFTLDALGLDTAARGVKIEDQRPDLIVLDDVDDDSDSERVALGKIETITRTLIPAGSPDVAVLAVQTLTNEHGFFARMADGRADYLRRRILSGPIPAVEDLEYVDSGDGWVITGGRASWRGLPLPACQAALDDVGLTAFLAEYQHLVEPPPGGMFDHVTFNRIPWSEIPWGLIVRSTVWVDPAVTDTAQSDSYGIQADAIAIDETIYRLWSWEARTSPLDALRRAIRTAWVIGAGAVGVETDQGGDTWAVVYAKACETMAEEWRAQRHEDPPEAPRFLWEKAGQGHGPKAHRASRMLADYETPGRRIVHVEGTHMVLERALRRFPKTKPLDLVDAAFWSWKDLRHGTPYRPIDPRLQGQPTLTGDLLTAKL